MLWSVVALLFAAVALLVCFYRLAKVKRRMRQSAMRLRRLEADVQRLRQRMCAADARDRLFRAGRQPRLPMEFTSQYGEDAFLWELFDGALEGFYIEVGAYDGHTFSVTYPFEAMGWTGVLVEAIPERYKACLDRRPNSLVAHAALSRRGPGGGGPGKTTTFTIVEGDPSTEMLSFMKASDAHKRLLAKSKGVERTITVPLSTMDDCLVAAGAAEGKRIDFAVIDVEGAEIDLLDGFDLEKHRPRVLVVEDMEPRNQASPGAYLARRHYVPVARVGVSTIFVRTDEPALMARAARITRVE